LEVTLAFERLAVLVRIVEYHNKPECQAALAASRK
jgi:hypothetical protein